MSDCECCVGLGVTLEYVPCTMVDVCSDWWGNSTSHFLSRFFPFLPFLLSFPYLCPISSTSFFSLFPLNSINLKYS